MSEVSNTYQVSGGALSPNEPRLHSFLLTDYCASLVNVEIPEDAIRTILLKRGVDGDAEFADVDAKTRDLLEADVYMWVYIGASKIGATTDSDNGWQHSGGSYSLTESDKKILLNKANAIYENYGESVVSKTKIRINSFGVMPSYRTVNGGYLDHITK